MYLEGRFRRNEEDVEHAGYILEIEVEASALSDAEELVGEQVAITGDVELVDFPERGKILILRSASAAAIEDDEEAEEAEEGEPEETEETEEA